MTRRDRVVRRAVLAGLIALAAGAAPAWARPTQPAPPAATAEPADDLRSPPSMTAADPTRLRDGSRFVLPPTTFPQDPPATDRRPIYVGAAIVLLALGLWWNRRDRDRFDADGKQTGRPRRGDDDADDLHAAARGEPAEPSESDRSDDRPPP